MPLRPKDGLSLLQFDCFPADTVAHAVFTRRGGVSQAPWHSLNVGATVGDRPEHVAENRRRLLTALDRSLDSTFDLRQVHSATIVVARAPRHGEPYPQADGVLTGSPEITLLMRFADCVPILLHDPQAGVVGLVHAGWLGTVRRTAEIAVQRMQALFGSNPEEVTAAIGPAIAGHHYPVGPEVVSAFEASFGTEAPGYLPAVNGAVHLDLPAANEGLLRLAGVGRIERSQLCTACHLDDWYSHRGERGHTGRFGAAIGLR